MTTEAIRAAHQAHLAALAALQAAADAAGPDHLALDLDDLDARVDDLAGQAMQTAPGSPERRAVFQALGDALDKRQALDLDDLDALQGDDQ